MVSQKVVTPVKTGVQRFFKLLKFLDSGFRSTSFGGLLMEVVKPTDRNDVFGVLATFYETIIRNVQ